jgi:hypothetical protein
MKLLLVPIPNDKWVSAELSLAREQARDAARRIGKNIDVSRERTRFSLACDRIESFALVEADYGYKSIEGAQAQLLLDALPTQGKTRVPFLALAESRDLLSRLPPETATTFKTAGGLVLLLAPFADSFFSEPPKGIEREEVTAPDYSLAEAELQEADRTAATLRIHDQIRTSIETGRPVGWVNLAAPGGAVGLARHELLTKVLRSYVNLKVAPTTFEFVKVKKRVPDKEALALRENKWWYRLLRDYLPSLLPSTIPTKQVLVDEKKVVYLPIVPLYTSFAFRDGSESAQFPLFCLLQSEQPQNLKIIHAALISGRHFELDREVDVCILRNSEMSRGETIADQERIAFERASTFIQSSLKRMNGLELHLYHTGLEPAVIGVYRAIVESLRAPSNRGRFVVIPKIFRRGRYDSLKAWY